MKLSVVIPVFANWAMTEACLRSLFEGGGTRAAPGSEVEVIVVDNGSFDETPQGLERMARPGLVALRMPKNLGFAKACNAGAAKAQGRFLVFLNNDMIVLPGALDVLLATISGNDAIGVCGARLLYANGTVQHAGVALDEQFLWRHVFRGVPGEHAAVLVKRPFQAVTGACLAISRDFFQKLGGFDEQFLNGYEDIDLCLRAREAGKEVVYEPESVLYHFESMSDGRINADSANCRRLQEKWGARLTPDLYEKTERFLEKLRDALDAEARGLLESASSPYRTVPYPAWKDDAAARRLQSLAFRSIACDATNRAARLSDEVERLKRGTSYRLGLALTWLPRKLLGR